MSFTLSHVIRGASRAPEVLSSETAAYIVLSLAEQTMGAPREVGADNVLLHASGALVVADVPHCDPQSSDECLRGLLTALLESVPSATVSNAVRQVAAGQAKGPVALRTELHAALVPLNRAAARRALTRLHRKLSALFSDSLLTLSEPPVGVSRRARRRNVSELSPVDDIPVTLELSEANVESVHNPLEAAPTRGFWHPSQTTPWQFNEAALERNEGTPIFGSLTVTERTFAAVDTSVNKRAENSDVVLEAPPLVQWHAGQDEQTEAEAPVALRQARQTVHAVPQMPEHDTTVDHPVVSKEGLTVAHLRRASSRRSRVSELVQSFTPGESEPAEHVVAELYNMATHNEGEFAALGTATPPPVARESLLPRSASVKHRPRRIVLKASMALVPVVAFWFAKEPASGVTSGKQVGAVEPHECQATVRVSVPAQARVFLNDQHERQEQSGPIATFQKVSCRGQAEVTVRIPEPSGSPLPDAWVRVPLPEADLTRAASIGRALEVEPLAF